MRSAFWLGVGMLASAVGATIVATRRGAGLAGVRNVPERVREQLANELDDAERRAYAAGARGELEFVGAGAEGIVFCDEADRAFKVARFAGDHLQDEARWFQMATKVPSLKPYVPTHVRYDAEHKVITRECVKPYGRRPRGLWELHQRLASVMKTYGYGRPEFKEDSYVMTRRGPVLVDAGFAIKHGQPLVREALDVLNQRKPATKDRLKDLAWELRMERGETIPEPVANRLLRRLQAREPSIELEGT